ncbi:MAG: hypothetical protein KGM42_06680 [Hyphomicrobiales bacterium]|nr:hypothetical protein [Hyphomicrobiales bacterium]
MGQMTATPHHSRLPAIVEAVVGLLILLGLATTILAVRSPSAPPTIVSTQDIPADRPDLVY